MGKAFWNVRLFGRSPWISHPKIATERLPLSDVPTPASPWLTANADCRVIRPSPASYIRASASDGRRPFPLTLNLRGLKMVLT